MGSSAMTSSATGWRRGQLDARRGAPLERLRGLSEKSAVSLETELQEATSSPPSLASSRQGSQKL
jgi:hypothetical protein